MSGLPDWAVVLLWGLLAAAALPLGAAFGALLKLPQRLVASVMAFGAGALIAALSLELMQEAHEQAGFGAAAAAFIIGGVVFTLADAAIKRWGGRHRKRSGSQMSEDSDSQGLAIAVGSLLDNVPEMLVLGMGISSGQPNLVMLCAIFVSNLPEGLSSAAGMKQAGRSPVTVLAIWFAIGILAAASAVIGHSLFGSSGPASGIASAVAAGAMLTMIVDTMIPEAFEKTHEYSGMITALGFLLAFALHQWQ